jgi:type VI secretion system protein ImpM
MPGEPFGAGSHGGFYGKLPGRADFVMRGLPETFLTPLGDWFERCLAAGRAALGPRWSDVYLTSPAWQFALSAGLAGRQAAVGVLVPSLDRSGREFPFVVAACSDGTAGAATLAIAASAWLANAAEIAIGAVTRDVDPARIEMQLASLGPVWAEMPRLARPVAGDGHWRLAGSGTLATTLPHILDQAVAGLGRPSLWWSDGSALVEPTTLACDGLPEPEQFPAMIDGQWQAHGF